MGNLRELAYRVDPALWVRNILCVEPTKWPMRARRPEARFAMLSTAWSRTDPFRTAWDSDDPSLIRLKATADIVPFDPEFLGERAACAR